MSRTLIISLVAIALIVVAVVVVVKNEKPAPVTVETPPNLTI